MPSEFRDHQVPDEGESLVTPEVPGDSAGPAELGDDVPSTFDSWATRGGLCCPHWGLVFVLELPRDVPWDEASQH